MNKAQQLIKSFFAPAAGAAGLVAANVQAAVPTGVESAFTTMSTDFGTILGYAYTAGAVVVGGGVIFAISWKLLKRVGSKA